MTKSEIEKLIEYINDNISDMITAGNGYIIKESEGHQQPIYCKMRSVFDLLRNYPVEPETTCDKLKVSLFLDGDATPLNLVKALVETRLLSVHELTEMAAYLKVYTDHHSMEGFLR